MDNLSPNIFNYIKVKRFATGIHVFPTLNLWRIHFDIW